MDGQRASQGDRWISLGPPRRHGEPHHLTDGLKRSLRRFDRAPVHDAARHTQYQGGAEVRDRPVSEVREYVPLQATDDPLPMRGNPVGLLLRVPLPRQGLKGIRSSQLLGCSLRARINPVGDRPTSFLAPLTGYFERHIRVHAERQKPLLAVVAVLEPPVPGPIGVDQKVEPTLIETLERLRLGLQGPDGSISQRHWGTSSDAERCTPKSTPARRALGTDPMVRREPVTIYQTRQNAEIGTA